MDDVVAIDAVDELRRRITAGAYEDGRLPPERVLAEAVGVSRRVLRQALDVLEREGLIWRRQGHGTFIGSPDVFNEPQLARLAHNVSPPDIVEARLSIEPLLVRHAALRASKADIDALLRLAQSARDARNAKVYETFDIAFHRRIADASRNALFVAMYEMLNHVRLKVDSTRLREYHFEHNGASESYDQHMRIIDAIATHDPEAAEQAMRDHLYKIAAAVRGSNVSVLDLQ
jgi:GntR family transcriptional repressor for pyruvate dehydrogenase complex